jgi:hypothetical protein
VSSRKGGMTAEKRAREQRLRERRTLKEAKRAARRQARADGQDVSSTEAGLGSAAEASRVSPDGSGGS